jgi:hypothetical protein
MLLFQKRFHDGLLHDDRVGHYWIADPASRTLETYRLDPDARAWVDSGAFDGAACARIAPFEAVELDLARVFPPPPKEP